MIHLPNRRKFIKTSAATVTAGLLSNELEISRCAHAQGNQRIRVGLVGCGGRGTGSASQALTTGPDVELYAVGDVFQDRLDLSVKNLRSKPQVNIPAERQFVGFDAYQKVLQSGVDVVILATPGGFRPLHFEAAVQAGKHVLLEKPVAVDGPGIRSVLRSNQLAIQKNLKVAVGYQRRHQQNYQETIKRIQSGSIGKIQKLEAFWRTKGVWIRPRQSDQTEMEYQLRNWMYFVWLSGDIITEFLGNNIDVCNWIQGGHPIKAKGSGGRKENTGPDHGEIFDHFEIEYEYSNGVKMNADVRFSSTGQTGIGEVATGTSGVADLAKASISGSQAWKYTGTRNNSYQTEHDLLFDAIRKDRPYNMAGDGLSTAIATVMGRMAAYSGQEINEDQVMNSVESFTPTSYQFTNTSPPTLPDKFGDYQIPARGRQS